MDEFYIDPSTKLILQYIEDVRDSSKQKKRKLRDVTKAIRPEDFQFPLQKLCDILVRFAYNGRYVNDVYRDHIMQLVEDQSLCWSQVITSVINTTTDSAFSKCQRCELIRGVIHRIQVKSFDDKSHADNLVMMIRNTFFFLTQLIIDVLANEEELDVIRIEYEDSRKLYQKPLDALSALIHDDYCRTILFLSMKNPTEATKQLEHCRDAFLKLRIPDELSAALMEMLLEKQNDSCKQKQFEYSPKGITLFKVNNPSIRALIPIFACYIDYETSENMAKIVLIFAEIMRFSGSDVIFDILHAAVMLKCEESIELLHFPKQSLIDFRWQSTTFFYRKLSEIIEHLIRSGEVTVSDVEIGLHRALNELSMMFDAADMSWKNASFLNLLNALEPCIGKNIADPLRQRRREHMKTNPQLVAFAETDEQIIENTEIHMLLNAVKKVTYLHLGQMEEFCLSFIEKIHNGQSDEFDAITSILIAEGRLMEVGKYLILKNKAAQEPSKLANVTDRIRIFDETFLSLSRILMKNPNVSVRLIVNGGPGKTEGERAIFCNWSMRFVKRVQRHGDPDPKTENERESLRKEAEMLVKLACADVGIEYEQDNDEFQNDDDFQMENILVEKDNQSVENSMEDIQFAEEVADIGAEEKKDSVVELDRMNTLDKTIESMNVSIIPPNPENNTAEISKQLTEIEHRKEKPSSALPVKQLTEKKTPDVTWFEIHCPLPRISNKTARKFLAQIKEGVPFWRTDDPNLNLGAIVAAIPRIGQLLLEEHEEKRHRTDRKFAEENMTNILRAMESMSCIFVCLIQWLDCQPESAARTSLAFALNTALEAYASSATVESSCDNHSKWGFIKSTVQHIFNELVEKSSVFPEITCTAFSSARRFCPFLTRNEPPDQIKMKHSWYFIRHQSWPSPHALRIVRHANVAREYDAWSHIYISKMIKCGCGDMMLGSVDMILAIMMLEDINSIVRVHESLFEFWLGDEVVATSRFVGRFDPLSLRAIIRLMTGTLLLSEWRLDRLLNEGPPFVPRLKLEKTFAPEPEDPDQREKWIFLLKEMLERTVNRFVKIAQKGLLSHFINFIIQLMKSIAGSADCKAKRLLVRRIPPELIYQLAYIEPSSVDYELINAYCDPENEEHTRTKVMCLSALRRATGFGI